MAELTYRPEALLGSCHPDHGPEAVCQLWVNTTQYPEVVIDLGPPWEQLFSKGTQWFTFILSVIMTAWFIYNLWTGHCGWEVIFVTIIEFIKIVVEIFYEYDTPCMIWSVFGPVTPWLRYLEWLLTCPVILIHLSNLTGLDDEYSARTMNLLASDQGTICFGTTAAFTPNGWIKVMLFLCGLSFGINTFYTASRVYIESYHKVPKGICRSLVKFLTGMFFCSWLMFPALFIAGPEGTGYLTWSGSTISHTVADLLSKNIWGLVAHYLQVKIREHIIIHGDVRTKVEKTVAGHTFEVEGFRDEDDDDASVNNDSKLDRRASFQMIAKRLEKNGQDIKLGGADGVGDMETAKPMQQQPMMGGGIAAFGQTGGAMDPQQMMMMMHQMQQMQQMQQQQPQQQMGMGMDPMQQMQQQPMMQMTPQNPMMAQQGMMTPSGQMSPGGPMYPGNGNGSFNQMGMSGGSFTNQMGMSGGSFTNQM